MKLTNYMRDAFVKAAMHDVPNVDYTEQIRTLAKKFTNTIHTALDINDLHLTRLNRQYCYIDGNSYTFPGVLDSEIKTFTELPEIVAVVSSNNKQSARRQELFIKLKGAIYACSTRKQAVTALPDFEKYLPMDTPQAIQTLPAIANVFSDFVKAGWPKKTLKTVSP